MIHSHQHRSASPHESPCPHLPCASPPPPAAVRAVHRRPWRLRYLRLIPMADSGGVLRHTHWLLFCSHTLAAALPYRVYKTLPSSYLSRLGKLDSPFGDGASAGGRPHPRASAPARKRIRAQVFDTSLICRFLGRFFVLKPIQRICSKILKNAQTVRLFIAETNKHKTDTARQGSRFISA